MKINDNKSFEFVNPKGFLVVEGLNGAGKTVLINKIQSLCMETKECLSTREPGASQLGKKLRTMLLDHQANPRSDLAELFLFSADRAEHVSKIIKPALERGACVISDRYYYSTASFQGYGRGLDHSIVAQVNSIAVQGLLPDLVLFLDVDPEEGLKRTGKRKSQEQDSFEDKELEFHNNLRRGFLELSESLPEPFVVVDAMKAEVEVWNFVEPIVKKWLKSL